MGGRALLNGRRENRQIPIPESRIRSIVEATNASFLLAAESLNHPLEATGGTACEIGLSTGPMKRYPRRGRVSTNSGIVGFVSQCESNLGDCCVQGVVKIDERVFGPDLLA